MSSKRRREGKRPGRSRNPSKRNEPNPEIEHPPQASRQVEDANPRRMPNGFVRRHRTRRTVFLQSRSRITEPVRSRAHLIARRQAEQTATHRRKRRSLVAQASPV